MIEQFARRGLSIAGQFSDAIFGPASVTSAHRLANELRLPTYFVQQLLLIEDKRFAYHPGVDLISVVRALLFNVGTAPSRWHGASTITQQIYSGAARLHGHYRPTIRFKVTQSTWAILSTLKRSKVDVLRDYLDSVYFGRSYFGLDRAAVRFCGKIRHDLTIADSFFLVERIARPNTVSFARIDMLTRRAPIAAILDQEIGISHQLVALYDRHFGCGREIAKCLEKSLTKSAAPTSTCSAVASSEQ